MYKNFFKRFFDIIISLIGITVFSIPAIIIAIIIKFSDGGNVIFVQKRLGKNKKIFKLYKFRSMNVNTPENVPKHLMENPEQYITRIGKFIRKTSLDEIPQFINILFGKMSVVGPRPALPNQKDLISERDKYGANDIKPGLTGWAQINGRDELDNEVKAAYDGEYTKKLSFWFDCKCFFGTILPVIKCRNVKEGKTEKNENVEKNEKNNII